ncbi:MAG: class I SAM-dependent methyltransferase [Christensenellaceae bacterium]|jgi:SAM-dependent methyltransferase|nr:class I SAM-dependent methyltransferase [Christensenellaceae bacterium]
MPLNWIDPANYPFNSFLLPERFQIRLMMDSGGWRNKKGEWRRCMGIALNANPAVKWYLEHRCPECAEIVEKIAESAPKKSDPARIREAEIYALASVEDFVIYTTPEVMAEACDFLRGWHKERLFQLVPLWGKTVLDVGIGSGRLAFAAAERAAFVYASEPVSTLRAFLREKIAKEGIQNLRVADGFITALPYPDDLFDIVLCGHVLGDDWDAEIAEISRVCKDGGWLVQCPGGQKGKTDSPELLLRGWEAFPYAGSFGAEVVRYRKQVFKA